jgi:hypothetical protein
LRIEVFHNLTQDADDNRSYHPAASAYDRSHQQSLPEFMAGIEAHMRGGMSPSQAMELSAKEWAKAKEHRPLHSGEDW